MPSVSCGGVKLDNTGALRVDDRYYEVMNNAKLSGKSTSGCEYGKYEVNTTCSTVYISREIC